MVLATAYLSPLSGPTVKQDQNDQNRNHTPTSGLQN